MGSDFVFLVILFPHFWRLLVAKKEFFPFLFCLLLQMRPGVAKQKSQGGRPEKSMCILCEFFPTLLLQRQLALLHFFSCFFSWNRCRDLLESRWSQESEPKYEFVFLVNFCSWLLIARPVFLLVAKKEKCSFPTFFFLFLLEEIQRGASK